MPASLVRWYWRYSIRNIDNSSPESIGKNEKSIWEHYNEMAAVEDNIREVQWRDSADTTIVFVSPSTRYDASLLILLQDGLFAILISVFLLFTILQLQPNSTDIAMDTLIHISQQLSNSTAPPYFPTEFTASTSIAAANVLFCLSLAVVLIDAFLAMLVKSWLQEFDRGWRKYTVANLRAQERERRLQGLERWKLPQLVALLPILMQISILCFSIGLQLLLFRIHLISAICASVAHGIGVIFYMFTTSVSIFDAYAPFSSPVSRSVAILFNALQITWMSFTRNVQGIISRPFPSYSQIDPQTYAGIFERLVTTTAEAVENIPVFLELLNQPVKDLTLLPSNVQNWRHLLHVALGLLGDPSTFSDSAAQTIARTLLFCYDDDEPADRWLSRRLKYHFDQMSPGQTKYATLNSLFASYLGYYCGFRPTDSWTVRSIIVSLEPSNAADAELLWIVNTVHRNLLWKATPAGLHDLSLEFFTAMLTYVSSTEQSGRSQVPLTAAIIHAMHTIKSALDTDGIGSIGGPYVLPGTVLTASASQFVTFHQSDPLDLWSDHCVGLASALLQPHTHWSGPSAGNVWKFQLALVAALYIDSTKRAGHATVAFGNLLTLTNIPNITENTWDWVDVYDRTKLAGYWHMALFRDPIYQDNSPFRDLAYVITQTIGHLSDPRLSALHLLDISVKHLRGMASSSSNFVIGNANEDSFVQIAHDDLDGYRASGPFNPWILLHLDTLFSPKSILHRRVLEQLEWADTPEQVHIAKARLARYDSLQGEGYQGAEHLKPEPHFLKLIIWSKDYAVCTSAFRCCLNLAAVDQRSSTGDIHSAGMFIPEAMGRQWITHLIQVLCGPSESEVLISWKFLSDHLIPIWAMLPPSWCHDFALEFLFSDVHLYNQPAYRCFTDAHRQEVGDIQNNTAFLPFIKAMLDLTQHTLNRDQLTSLETWLVGLPETLENHDAHVKLENILATAKQQIVSET